MANDDLTAEVVRELLNYNSETGVFTWKKKAARRVQVGDVAGCINQRYRSLTVLGKRYLAHRVAWLYTHGKWPEGVIDHINRDAFDNRIANLRDVTQMENLQNASSKSNNKSGVEGVFWDKQRQRWRAEIRVNYKTIALGRFTSKADAAAARAEAKVRLHASINRQA